MKKAPWLRATAMVMAAIITLNLTGCPTQPNPDPIPDPEVCDLVDGPTWYAEYGSDGNVNAYTAEFCGPVAEYRGEISIPGFDTQYFPITDGPNRNCRLIWSVVRGIVTVVVVVVAGRLLFDGVEGIAHPTVHGAWVHPHTGYIYYEGRWHHPHWVLAPHGYWDFHKVDQAGAKALEAKGEEAFAFAPQEMEYVSLPSDAVILPDSAKSADGNPSKPENCVRFRGLRFGTDYDVRVVIDDGSCDFTITTPPSPNDGGPTDPEGPVVNPRIPDGYTSKQCEDGNAPINPSDGRDWNATGVLDSSGMSELTMDLRTTEGHLYSLYVDVLSGADTQGTNPGSPCTVSGSGIKDGERFTIRPKDAGYGEFGNCLN